MFNSKHRSDSALLMHAETAMCYIIVVALTLPVKTVQQYLSQESCSRLCRNVRESVDYVGMVQMNNISNT